MLSSNEPSVAYMVGRNVEKKDLKMLQDYCVSEQGPFLGCDYAFDKLEAKLQTIGDGPWQLFLLGSTSFHSDVVLNEEAFMRRYPAVSRFLRHAKPGNESGAYAIHKSIANVELYIINLYRRHRPTISLGL